MKLPCDSWKMTVPYQIEWKPSALKEFRKLSAKVRSSVQQKVESLADNPRPDGCRKLSGLDHTYRIRLGNYRIIYEIEDKRVVVQILRIRPRSDSYRDL